MRGPILNWSKLTFKDCASPWMSFSQQNVRNPGKAATVRVKCCWGAGAVCMAENSPIVISFADYKTIRCCFRGLKHKLKWRLNCYKLHLMMSYKRFHGSLTCVLMCWVGGKKIPLENQIPLWLFDNTHLLWRGCWGFGSCLPGSLQCRSTHCRG